MKITSLTIVNSDSRTPGSAGLKECTMQGLGPVVLLAGPNGGGKTRLLKTVTTMTAAKLTSDDIGRMESENKNSKESLKYQSDLLQNYQKDPSKKI